MQIECTTTSAASQVLWILTEYQLRPGKEFHMDGPNLPEPPVSFSIHVNPLSQVMRRFRSIPGISIEREHAA